MTLALIYTYSVVLFFACAAPLSADELCKPGLRSMNLADWIILQQDREEEEGSEPSDNLISSPEGSVTIDLITRSTHPGAFHFPIHVGEYITLEDGSVWRPSRSDLVKIANWLPSDLVVITTNKQWFSSYMFRLTNRNSGESIKCNLHSVPVHEGFFTHWIIAINPYTHELCLEDGSLWQISSSDYPIATKWLVNDTVIIGLNDGLLSATRPNILINVDTLSYVRGNCTWKFTVLKK